MVQLSHHIPRTLHSQKEGTTPESRKLKDYLRTLHTTESYLISESESEVTQSCLTVCDPMDCSPPGSSDHGILPARILEWVAMSFSRGSSQPRDRTQVSRIEGRCFNLWTTREVGLHRTIQLQFLQHYWSGHRFGLPWYWMISLRNEQRSVCCSMLGSKCCFSTCIQISQEACKVVWYSRLFLAHT